jgi:DNA primase
VHDVSEWPTKAALWLYKAGLGRPEIARLGAYYHPPSDRVVLPILDGSGAPVFWQARAPDKRQPKYMAAEVDRSLLVPKWGLAACPTLTEDILSAFKVGLVAEGWALMGTSASDALVNQLLTRNKHDNAAYVNVWLDPDAPGQRAASKVCKRLQAYGLTVRNIQSPKDPKLMTLQQIKEIL